MYIFDLLKTMQDIANQTIALVVAIATTGLLIKWLWPFAKRKSNEILEDFKRKDYECIIPYLILIVGVFFFGLILCLFLYWLISR